MGNCLKTQLKESVNNDNLNKVGEMSLVLNNANGIFSVAYTSDRNLNQNDITLSDGVSISWDNPSYPTITGTGYIVIKNKYDIERFSVNTSGVTFDVKTLKFCGSLTTFLTSVVNTTIKDIAIFSNLPSSVKTLRLQSLDNNSFSGNINYLSNLSNIEALELYRFAASVATMEQLATLFPNLNNLMNTEGHAISGSIESFVTVRRQQGVTTGSVSLDHGQYSDITFNGENIVVEGYDTTPFSWTSNTITFNGVTINA